MDDEFQSQTHGTISALFLRLNEWPRATKIRAGIDRSDVVTVELMKLDAAATLDESEAMCDDGSLAATGTLGNGNRAAFSH